MHTQAAHGWLYLIGAILAEVAATLSLKGALDHPALFLVIVTGYIGALVLLALALRTGVPIGVAYGIWGAAGVALTAIFSNVLFEEPLTPTMGLGIAAIIVGVLLVELGSHSGNKKAIGDQP